MKCLRCGAGPEWLQKTTKKGGDVIVAAKKKAAKGKTKKQS